MRLSTALAGLAAVLVLVAASGPADARGGHGHRGHWHGGVRLGIVIGAPALWYSYPRYYYPPAHYYPPAYYPPVVAVPSSPPVYIERGDTQAEPERQSNYWYYCPGEKAYYPYVKQCPGGWQRVVPQPPPS